MGVEDHGAIDRVRLVKNMQGGCQSNFGPLHHILAVTQSAARAPVGKGPGNVCSACGKGGRTDAAQVGLGLALEVDVVEVLAWVDCLVLEALDELVEAHGDERAQVWPGPVDPVIVVEGACDYGGTEGASGVYGAGGEVDAVDSRSALEREGGFT